MINQSLAFWQSFISSQLKNNLSSIVQNSIKNFHFPGLNYVCFQFTPELTIRLYIIDPEVQPINTRNVNIHNHLYDSQLLCLQGQIKNTVYKLDNSKDDYNMYHLTSALHPENTERKIQLDFLGRRGLCSVSEKTLLPGDFHFQPHTEIHSVTNKVDLYTAFMVFEFQTVKNNSTLFTKENYTDTIPTPNAYLRYWNHEIKDLLTRLLLKMESANGSA